MQGNILNVSALNGYINAIFRSEELLHNIQVAGEVSNFKVFKGHAYFILKDENSQINCACFNCVKTYAPKDGESVILSGSVDYYAAGGKLNFNVDSVKPIGHGQLALKLEMLKIRLTQEGLFDVSCKKPIPLYPINVCVVTSFNGAVIKDIKRTIRRKNDIINIFVKDVKVQGKDAHLDIIKALERVDKMNYDVIIIARGGGSAEELMPFNDEGLVREIFRCKTPIISAVGHESDVTLCDEVADYRAATPTAAAEKVAFDTARLKAYLLQNIRQIRRSLDGDLAAKERDLRNKSDVIKSQMMLTFSKNAGKISAYAQNLKSIIDKALAEAEKRYSTSVEGLTARNPLGILQKGYWYVTKNDAAAKSVKVLNIDDAVTLKTHDGEVKATITEV